MATAVQTSPGLYTVTVNGMTIPNVPQNNLPAYGIGTTASSGASPTAPTSTTGNNIYTDASGNSVYDYNGQTYSATTGQPVSASAASSGGVPGFSGIQITPTGDSGLDSILTSIKGLADNLVNTGYTIPANLQITPSLVSQFLSWAHQAVDPYTQQQISSRLADVNANLAALDKNYQNQVAEREQQFGTDLSTEQNAAGASGTAFSGQRNINELNLAATANRDLGNLATTAGYNIGSAARSAASDVGATNAGGIVLPSLSTGTVSLSGGQRGSVGSGPAVSYNYDPSIYKVGTIPSTGTQNANQLEQSYISQYGTLAGANSNGSRSMSDLFGMMSGLPSGYTVPSNLT